METGNLLKQLPLDVGTVQDFSGDKEHSEIFYLFTSFLTPGIIYTADLLQKEIEPKVIIFFFYTYKLYILYIQFNNFKTFYIIR